MLLWVRNWGYQWLMQSHTMSLWQTKNLNSDLLKCQVQFWLLNHFRNIPCFPSNPSCTSPALTCTAELACNCFQRSYALGLFTQPAPVSAYPSAFKQNKAISYREAIWPLPVNGAKEISKGRINGSPRTKRIMLPVSVDTGIVRLLRVKVGGGRRERELED